MWFSAKSQKKKRAFASVLCEIEITFSARYKCCLPQPQTKVTLRLLLNLNCFFECWNFDACWTNTAEGKTSRQQILFDFSKKLLIVFLFLFHPDFCEWHDAVETVVTRLSNRFSTLHDVNNLVCILVCTERMRHFFSFVFFTLFGAVFYVRAIFLFMFSYTLFGAVCYRNRAEALEELNGFAENRLPWKKAFCPPYSNGAWKIRLSPLSCLWT